MEEVDKEDDYEIKSSTSKKRGPVDNLPRTSKRLKSLWTKIGLLKTNTRIRVWWTEGDILKPTWYVGTVKQLYPEKQFFRIVYDYEIEVCQKPVNILIKTRKQILKKVKRWR